GRGEVEHRVVLFLVPLLPPARVVHVLAASGGIEADRLDMTVRPRADPDFLPGGRDDQVLDPGQFLGGYRLAVRVQIAETAAGADPPDTGAGQVAAPEP